eukprot:8279323-Lingulodinium_polyedra.AAC.1
MECASVRFASHCGGERPIRPHLCVAPRLKLTMTGAVLWRHGTIRAQQCEEPRCYALAQGHRCEGPLAPGPGSLGPGGRAPAPRCRARRRRQRDLLRGERALPPPHAEEPDPEDRPRAPRAEGPGRHRQPPGEKPTGYEQLWNCYGKYFKAGPAGDLDCKDELKPFVCFWSSSCGDNMASLGEYVGRVKEGQDKICFVAGEGKRAAEI